MSSNSTLFIIRMVLTIQIVIVGLLLIQCIGGVSSVILVGVTIRSSPFVYTNDNKFSGFCIDLMNLISEYSGLNYSLYLVQDNSYGPGDHTYAGSIQGLIGDVYQKKADFALADMTVTERRSKYVQFTEPFLRFSFSALVRRRLARNLQNMDDLAIKSNLSIGTYLNGKTLYSMQNVSKDIRNVRWLHRQILKHENNLVLSMDEALYKVINEPYAFIQEEPKNLYYSAQNCSLKTLTDQNQYLPSEYAIAVQKDSPYLEAFNKAIKLIQIRGQMKKLVKKHFYNSECRNRASSKISGQIWIFPFCCLTILLSNFRIFWI